MSVDPFVGHLIVETARSLNAGALQRRPAIMPKFALELDLLIAPMAA
ncbi:hypothetical protein ACVWYH_001902 [Bradyrhizobium sp. GM24.11]